MSIVGSNALAGASGQATGGGGGGGGGGGSTNQIDRSVRLNSPDSAHFSRTLSSAGDRRTWTLSWWMKLGNLGANRGLFGMPGTSSGQPQFYSRVGSDDKLYVYDYNTSGTYQFIKKTAAVFRDPSAWYHCVFQYDSTQSTAEDGFKIYVNGTRITAWSTNTLTDYQQNYQGPWNSVANTGVHIIGQSDAYFDGYLAEIHFVDGTALAASDFGELDSNNVWIPKVFSGTYGTNGFKLNFSDNTNATTIAEDSSGNNNDWTANNITAAAADNNWADYVYAGGSTYSSTETGTNYFTGAGTNENLFDGSTSTQVGSENVGNGWVYFRPATAITGVTSLRIWGAYNDTTKINGTDYSESPSWSSTPGWVTVPSPPSSITEIAVRGSSSAAGRIAAIEVNGAILVDPIPASDLDSLIDTPTNYTASSGNNGGNYCVLNPLDKRDSPTYSNGNLQITGSGAAHCVGRSTFGVSSGKWYWEVLINSAIDSTYYPSPGICSMDTSVPNQLGDGASGHAYMANGQKYTSSSLSSYGAAFTQGDIIGFALDMDAGTLVAYKNGTSQGTMATGLTGSWSPSWNQYNSTSLVYNFGQRPFAYTPPTNHVSLCTQNLSDPTIADGSTVFDTVLYTGNATSSRAITGLSFSPDFLWIKSRSSTQWHFLADVIRGANKNLASNSTDAEETRSNRLLSFDSNGFTIDNNSTVNENNATFVAWAWDAGTSTVSNTDGTITSSVRANASAGFSIVKFTNGNGTVGHGLNSPPELIITKDIANTYTWSTYSKPTTRNAYLAFNSTAAAGTVSGMWGSAEPTSSVFGTTFYVASVGNELIAYCFSSVEGYSRVGSYTANANANGPFVYTGFRPKWVMVKASSSAGDMSYASWIIVDTERDSYNVADAGLLANSNAVEGTRGNGSGTAGSWMDILSNGFKIRYSGTDVNGTSGQTYIYLALAEHPFKTSRAR